MKSRLITLIAVIFAALIVSGCCVCCLPCGQTRYAYSALEELIPVNVPFSVNASPTPANMSGNTSMAPLPSPTVGT